MLSKSGIRTFPPIGALLLDIFHGEGPYVTPCGRGTGSGAAASLRRPGHDARQPSPRVSTSRISSWPGSTAPAGTVGLIRTTCPKLRRRGNKDAPPPPHRPARHGAPG